MEFLRPGDLAEACAMKANVHDTVPLAGGTDVMVELNFDKRRPEAILDLTGVSELTEWSRDGDRLRIGSGVTYARIIDELGALLPGLAMASRTVGSPQIRNRGTVGGNLGSASPAGDAHPPLLAGNADIEVVSVRGTRRMPASEFFLGPKRSALEPDELISAFLVAPADGPEQFAKIGTRNAMVIAVCSFGLALHPSTRTVGSGIGSAAPTPLSARSAERFLAEELDWESADPLPDTVVHEFGKLVAAAASPIDDVRGTAHYRKHALSVLARRTLTWAWNEFRRNR